jgi:N6-L-threonylcarbamoyladenine synthase
VRREARTGDLPPQRRADIAREFQHAVVDVLAGKALGALRATGLGQLVVAGGVGANRELRERLRAETARRGARVFFPDLEFCTDNGAMIAYAGACRLVHAAPPDYAFSVRPRWDLASLAAP